MSLPTCKTVTSPIPVTRGGTKALGLVVAECQADLELLREGL